MCNRRNQNLISRLGHDGWVKMYDPVIARRDFTEENDGPNEFGQRESRQSEYFRRHGIHDAIQSEEEARIEALKREKWYDDNFPWLEKEET